MRVSGSYKVDGDVEDAPTACTYQPKAYKLLARGAYGPSKERQPQAE